MLMVLRLPGSDCYVLIQSLVKASCILPIVLAVSISFGSTETAAASACTNLPPSKLEIYEAEPRQLEERTIPVSQLDEDIPAGIPFSRHTMMLTRSDLVAWFDIRHRTMPGEGGSFCDSPSLVRMGFGSTKREALLARPAADDDCVRKHLLDHEAVHARAYEEAVHQFIASRQAALRQGMAALKQTPAPSSDLAKARWEEGLRMILSAAKRQLSSDLEFANHNVDDPAALAALENACGGKIRQLEQNGERFQ
jgi:hypothetical protein